MPFLEKQHKKLSYAPILCTFLLLILVCPTVFAQTRTEFTPDDKFSFPDSNGSLSFLADGYYESATFVDGSWVFTGLVVNSSLSFGGQNLTVFVEDSDVTLRYFRRFVFNFDGFILSYAVKSVGEQTFDFGINIKNGAWSVYIDDRDYVPEGDGWSISGDSELTVTGATANVTLFFLSYSNYVDDTSNKSFFEQHSVAILSAVVAASTLVVALVIRVKFTEPKRYF